MNLLALAAIILGSFCVGITAQTPQPNRLALSGSVISVTPHFLYARDELPFVVYKLDLHLVLRNDGETPVIAFRPEGCVIKIEFLGSASYSDRAETELTTEPWVDPYLRSYEDPQRDSLLEYVKELEVIADPSKAGLLVIDPGKFVEFRLGITLNSGYSLEILPGQKRKDVLRSNPKSEFPALRLGFYQSFKRVRPDSAFLRNLQRKWESFGLLAVDGNGEFTLRSETILNKTN